MIGASVQIPMPTTTVEKKSKQQSQPTSGRQEVELQWINLIQEQVDAYSEVEVLKLDQ